MLPTNAAASAILLAPARSNNFVKMPLSCCSGENPSLFFSDSIAIIITHRWHLSMCTQRSDFSVLICSELKKTSRALRIVPSPPSCQILKMVNNSNDEFEHFNKKDAPDRFQSGAKICVELLRNNSKIKGSTRSNLQSSKITADEHPRPTHSRRRHRRSSACRT